MSSERPEEMSDSPVSRGGQQPSNAGRDSEAAGDPGPADEASRHEATVLVRGETIRDQDQKSRKNRRPRRSLRARKSRKPK